MNFTPPNIERPKRLGLDKQVLHRWIWRISKASSSNSFKWIQSYLCCLVACN